MSPPTVSVIIPCFNHGEFLPEAVESVTALQRQDVELIVVDDGSTDERTRRAIDALRGHVTSVVKKENCGPAAARNAGIAVSKGKYILPLDADNHLRPAYVEQGIRVLDARPEVGVVYGDAEYLGLRRGRWRVGPFDRDVMLQYNFLDTCAVYRRVVWEQNGGYDPAKLIQGLEDWDFWLGALEHGWQFVYVPEVLFEYRVAEGSMAYRTHGFEKQTTEYVTRKHGPLYREAWLQRGYQQDSLKWAVRNLGRVVVSRLQRKREGRPSGSP